MAGVERAVLRAGRNRSKPAPPERTLSDFRRPADQITLPKIAIFGGGRLFAIQNTNHLERHTLRRHFASRYLRRGAHGFAKSVKRVVGSGGAAADPETTYPLVRRALLEAGPRSSIATTGRPSVLPMRACSAIAATATRRAVPGHEQFGDRPRSPAGPAHSSPPRRTRLLTRPTTLLTRRVVSTKMG